MQTPWHVISLIEADNSRLAKEAIIAAEALAENTEFFDGCRLALDSMITFGLKQIPEKKDEGGTGLSWDNFSLVVTGFVNRTVTGNMARDTVARLMAAATREQWNFWYRRILIKDMKAGFSEGTINRVCEKKYPQYAIPVFSCQLAHDSTNHEEKVAGKKLIESKLDGVRVITIVYPDGRADQFSRNGKELVNFPHIVEQMKSIAYHLVVPTVFDGEIMSSSFQDLMKMVHRKSDVNSKDAVLNLFDVLTLDEFETGISDTPQKERSDWLSVWHTSHADQLPGVQVLAYEEVDLDSNAGQDRFTEINALAIQLGYEGIMLKDPNAGYTCDRSVAWLKLKPFIEVSLTVVGVEEGSTDSKFVGTMGALICQGTDDGKQIRVNVGGGYKIQARAQIWANYTNSPVTWLKRIKGKWITMTELPTGEAVIGQVVEVRADAITKSDDKDLYSLRFPRFRCWRGFAVNEKI